MIALLEKSKVSGEIKVSGSKNAFNKGKREK
jgi:UDP-N-acetylglucosamine enolpyruvyl transferase